MKRKRVYLFQHKQKLNHQNHQFLQSYINITYNRREICIILNAKQYKIFNLNKNSENPTKPNKLRRKKKQQNRFLKNQTKIINNK